MKQTYAALLFLLLVGSGGSWADDFTDRVYRLCVDQGGAASYSKIYEKGTDTVCRKALCKKSSDGQDIDTAKVNLETAAPYAYAGAVKEVCGPAPTVGNNSGNNNNGNNNNGNNNNGNNNNGNGNGNGNNNSGNNNGNGNGNSTTITLSGTTNSGSGQTVNIQEGHQCYKKCKKDPNGKDCLKCLGWRDSISVQVPNGVSVNGNTSVNVNNGNGNTNNNGNGNITINGDGNTVTLNVGGQLYNLPSYCRLPNGGCRSSCEHLLIDANRVSSGGGNRCEYSGSTRGCIGDDNYNRIVVRTQVGNDCVNCQRQKQSWLSGLAEVVGAIAPPLAYFGASYYQGKFYAQGQQAWANAATAGFEQCRLGQLDYMNYLQNNELPGLTPEQRRQLGCNGFQLGGYGNMGGWGGGNPWIAGGYTPGYMGGMMGPWGGYNPYGGGMAGGIAGGGMAGGIVGGIGFVNGGVGGLAAGGYPAGGFAQGGYAAGGYAQGGYPAGGFAQGGFAAGGFAQGGYPAGGFAQGGYAAGGYAQGGYPAGGGVGMGVGGIVGMTVGGIAQGGWQGGMAVGMAQGGWQGGMAVGGIAQGGWQGGNCGFAGCGGGGTWGGGGWGTGTIPWGGGGGGYWGNTGGYGYQQAYMQNQYAANQDAMFQQQGLANQFGVAGNNWANYQGGYGAAAYSPMNAGISLQGGVGLGWNGGVGLGFP